MSLNQPLSAADVRTSRSSSFSQQSDDSQTAVDFLRDQQLLEADAREALPYSIDSCTKILGPLRQNVFACLTCSPPPSAPGDPWSPAGVCYACSVQCHGEHKLVEIFQKRNFTCDCGTTRIPAKIPCSLRTNDATNRKGGVHSEEPDANNYNQNFRNRFCGCECYYDPFQQKGTMFQCLGLGTHEDGGCGEDWYHPGCLVGMDPRWFDKMDGLRKPKPFIKDSDGAELATITEESAELQGEARDAPEEAVDDDDDPPMPPGFPEEDDFEGFLCYKCVEANPWIKQYAGTTGFLPAVLLHPSEELPGSEVDEVASRKRKADADAEGQVEAKRAKNEANGAPAPAAEAPAKVHAEAAEPPAGQDWAEVDGSSPGSDCKLLGLPPPPAGRFSLFFKEGFRDHLCRCVPCLQRNARHHPQLLEEEEVYEPPMSASDDDGDGDGSTHGGGGSGGSLLERGESALRNMDRVRAIEGAMAYNHLKERLKPFFRRFADSGRAVSAEDIKAYFAQLRSDEQAIRDTGRSAADNVGGPGRREQSGY